MHHARIIAAHICRTRKPPEIGGCSLLRRGQARHVAQIGRYARSKILRHRGIGNGHRLVSAIGDGHRKSAGAPRGAILLFDQWCQQRLCPAPIARDRKAHRKAARDFIVWTTAQRHLIPALRPAVVSNKIIGQRPFGRHGKRIGPGALGFIERADRIDRIFRREIGLADQRLGPPVAGLDFIGTGQKTDGGFVVPQFERSLGSVI